MTGSNQFLHGPKGRVSFFEKFFYTTISMCLVIAGFTLVKVIDYGETMKEHGTSIEYINRRQDQQEKRSDRQDEKNNEQDKQLVELWNHSCLKPEPTNFKNYSR